MPRKKIVGASGAPVAQSLQQTLAQEGAVVRVMKLQKEIDAIEAAYPGSVERAKSVIQAQNLEKARVAKAAVAQRAAVAIQSPKPLPPGRPGPKPKAAPAPAPTVQDQTDGQLQTVGDDWPS